MPWVMQVKADDGQWYSVRPSHAGTPYKYDKKSIAARMLEVCYPDQCRGQRLAGIHFPYTNGTIARVSEIADETAAES